MRRIMFMGVALAALTPGLCLAQTHHVGEMSIREGDWIY